MFLTQAGKGLPALGQLMVGTKEWKAQVVSFYFRMFFGRGLATSEANYYLDAAKTFETSGFRAKALILDPGRPTGSLGETGTLPPEEGGPSVPPGEISGLYQQMFLEAPSATETTRASGLLAAAFADGADPKEAWRALCVWATSRR